MGNSILEAAIKEEGLPYDIDEGGGAFMAQIAQS